MRHQWTESPLAMLGKRSDAAVAAELGITTFLVFKMRNKLGIRPHDRIN
jgi:hypothetical protein